MARTIALPGLRILAPVLAALCSFMPAATEAAVTTPAAASVLEGWGPFRFGMTPDKVQALPSPGQPWKSLAIPASPQFSTLTSLGPVKEFGFDFDVLGMTFKTQRGLLIIALSSEKKIAAEDCRQSYLALVPAVEARYGSFAALGFTLNPGSPVSVHDIPGAKSQYRLFNTSNGFTMQAVRTFGPRTISLRGGYVGGNGGGTCFTDVWFQQPEPD
jgi:hypothetical protein